MDERCSMDDLDHGTQADGAALIVRKKLGAEQQQRGTDALPSSGPEILANVGNGTDARYSIAAELAFDGGQVCSMGP